MHLQGKPGTGRCWHGIKTQPCSRDEMYVATCNNDRRQRFSIMFINHDEVMIKVSRDNRCFQRNGFKIQLRSCDPTNDLQRWFSPRGAFFQRRFEIANPSLKDYCATQEVNVPCVNHCLNQHHTSLTASSYPYLLLASQQHHPKVRSQSIIASVGGLLFYFQGT